MANSSRMGLSERRQNMKNAFNRRLLEIIEKKKTCLCLAVDCTTTQAILGLVEKAAPYVCAVKVHVDIVEDFSKEFTRKLGKLATEHDFIVFEDRKFADTGSTVELQATAGLYEINRWAHLVTIHALPGQPILDAFQRVIGRNDSVLEGCLLIAELSTEGALTNLDSYRNEAVQLGKRNPEVVCGFICQKRVSKDPSFLYWTPGVNLSAKTDGSGQQWRTIEKAIVEDGNDIVIVGRALVNSDNFERDIVKYRDCSWDSLLQATK